MPILPPLDGDRVPPTPLSDHPERVLVCLSGAALSGRVLRAGRQLATSLGCEWAVVNVETPQEYRRPMVDRNRLADLLRQAAGWGAETAILPGQDIVRELLRYARLHNVTKIVVGKPPRERWREMVRPSVADALVRQSGQINVFIITTEPGRAGWPGLHLDARSRSLMGYVASLTALLGATLAGFALRPLLDPVNIALIYLVAIVFSATRWGLFPSILSSIVSVIVLDALFIPPYGLISIAGAQDLLTLAVFLLVAVVVSELGARVRAEVEMTRRREQEVGALYALSREIAFVQDWSKILDVALKQIGEVFAADAIALLPDKHKVLQSHRTTPLNATELRAAQWAFDHRETTGRGSPILPQVAFRFIPLQTAQGTFGVLGLRLRGKGLFPPDRRRLLETIAGQIAIALEHAELSAQAEQTRMLAESDRFRNALLSSISHDLRTPLAAIMGSASSLLDGEAQLGPPAQKDLLLTIQEEAGRLNRLVANLLNMTRLESGSLKPQRDWHSVEEVIGAALAYANLDGREVELQIAPDLPLATFDFVLIQQVLLNLLDNAVKFSPPGPPLEIRAGQAGTLLSIGVADRGVGIPEEELVHVFDKFYRAPKTTHIPGTGLGLSICKGIVEAHHGTIHAERRDGGGTCVIFTLPLDGMEETR
ncbi:MAG: ATP-binding protein [Anaerolineae bacterium]